MIYVNLSKKYPCEKMLGSNIAFPQEESSMVLQAQNSFVFFVFSLSHENYWRGFQNNNSYCHSIHT